MGEGALNPQERELTKAGDTYLGAEMTVLSSSPRRGTLELVIILHRKAEGTGRAVGLP